MIDREHLSRENLEQALREYSGGWECVVKGTDRTEVVVRKGAWRGTLLIAVRGTGRSIEENLWVLIEELFGDED